MGITTKRNGRTPKFDAQKAGKIIAGYVPGAILRRTDQGISSDGSPFAAYRPSYADRLSAMGEDGKVDLRLTGGLMASIKARHIDVHADGVRVTIAPDAGTSPVVVPADGRARRTGRRGPPHNVLAHWIHYGTPTMQARPFMALSKEQEDELLYALRKAQIM